MSAHVHCSIGVYTPSLLATCMTASKKGFTRDKHCDILPLFDEAVLTTVLHNDEQCSQCSAGAMDSGQAWNTDEWPWSWCCCVCLHLRISCFKQAYMTAGRTSGHSLAASTKTGMNATWPSTVNTTESPSTKSSLLSPSALLVPASDRISTFYLQFQGLIPGHKP